MRYIRKEFGTQSVGGNVKYCVIRASIVIIRVGCVEIQRVGEEQTETTSYK